MSDRHQRNNDAQLASYRRDQPELWARLLDSLSEAERADVIARANAAEIDSFVIEWDCRSDALARVATALRGEGIGPRCPRCGQIFTSNGRCGCTQGRQHVTGQMLADIWQDGRRDEVAQILSGLDERDRNRVETEYLKLLHARGHRITLRVVKQQFELVIALPGRGADTSQGSCVVERLAA